MNLSPYSFQRNVWSFFGKRPHDFYGHWDNAPTILICHWFFCNVQRLWDLWKSLSSDFNVVYSETLPFLNLSSIEIASQKFQKKLDQVLKKNPRELILLGHSMGGLIILNTVKDYTSHISKIITCATPYRWCDTAKWWKSYVPACRNLVCDSLFLNDFEIPEDIILEYHTSLQDGLVSYQNQHPKKLHKNIKEVLHQDFNHLDFIINRQDRQTTKEFVQKIV